MSAQNRRPHELRVIAEKAELEVRIFALEQFLASPLFAKVDPAEQERLKQQAAVMATLFDILNERIAAFPPMPEVKAETGGARITELNPELAGQAVFKEEVPIGAQPIADVDSFAMLVDHWHGVCMERGNRMLQIPEGTTIEVEDQAKPGEVIAMDLNGAYLQVFRVGVQTALYLFKDLPFGASLEDAPEAPAEAQQGQPENG